MAFTDSFAMPLLSILVSGVRVRFIKTNRKLFPAQLTLAKITGCRRIYSSISFMPASLSNSKLSGLPCRL